MGTSISKHREFERDEIANDAWEEEPALSREQIDLVVAQIKRITRCANLELALRVGAVIIHHFYGGNMTGWRSRAAKTSSFRRLAEHPDLPLSAGALYRCVALFELCERLKAPSRWAHLGASHLRMVLGLPPEAQERLLALANEQRWTVKSLQLAIGREKAPRSTRGGRRRGPMMTQRLKAVKKCLEENADALLCLQMSSPEEIQSSVVLIEETRAHVESLLQSLRIALGRMEAVRTNRI